MGSVNSSEPPKQSSFSSPPSPSPSSSSPKSRIPAHPDAPPKFETVEQIDAFVDDVFPGPHRCNPRVDDLLQGIFRFPPSPQGTFGAFIRCIRSNPGEEPTTPYKYLSPDYFSKKEAQFLANKDMLKKFYMDQAIMREEQEVAYKKAHPAGGFDMTSQNLAPLLLGPNSSGSRGYDSTGTRSYPAISFDDLTPFKEDSGRRTRIDVKIENQQNAQEVELRQRQQAKRDAFIKAHSSQEQSKEAEK